ncbi:MAG: type II toxin-antitoxin system RelE/ParE family toxin [Deltaproteobacteria bacterium]|nr:type II toxin-antitoxin system RelE/ParE family toxin [Deltaproteobacteria bacterium]
MKLRWTRPALADLVEAQNYIAKDNPSAAEAVAQRVWEAVNSLCNHPEIGRQGHVHGTREWPVSQTPYLVVYRLRDETVEILRVWHGRRNWQANPTGR